MNDEFDIGGAAQAAPDKLEVLNSALEETIAFEEAVAQMEEDLKVAKRALNSLKTSRIPDLMTELQMDEIKFRGWQVKVADFISGSLPKDPEARQRAMEWLEANEGGPLIKTDVALAFTKSQHNEAIDLARRLEEQGFAPSIQSGVHPQTLQAFARERIRNGDQIDTDLLGLYTGKVAKLKRTEP